MYMCLLCAKNVFTTTAKCRAFAILTQADAAWKHENAIAESEVRAPVVCIA